MSKSYCRNKQTSSAEIQGKKLGADLERFESLIAMSRGLNFVFRQGRTTEVSFFDRRATLLKAVINVGCFREVLSSMIWRFERSTNRETNYTHMSL